MVGGAASHQSVPGTLKVVEEEEEEEEEM